MQMKHHFSRPLLIAIVGATVGCRQSELADFALEDVNPNSDRYGESISPGDYAKQVSGWYFIHAT